MILLELLSYCVPSEQPGLLVTWAPGQDSPTMINHGPPNKGFQCH